MTLSEAFDAISHGQPLAVPHNGLAAELAAFRPGHRPIPVSPALLAELLGCGQLVKLSELGEPPAGQRKPGEGWRNGWHELGWAGEHYDFYVFLQ